MFKWMWVKAKSWTWRSIGYQQHFGMFPTHIHKHFILNLCCELQLFFHACVEEYLVFLRIILIHLYALKVMSNIFYSHVSGKFSLNIIKINKYAYCVAYCTERYLTFVFPPPDMFCLTFWLRAYAILFA